jgi:hypothetical protein
MQLTTASAYTVGPAITPSDTALITCRALWVGGAGAVALSASPSAAAVTLSAVPAGSILPVGLDQGRVMATNTTATLIIALQ